VKNYFAVLIAPPKIYFGSPQKNYPVITSKFIKTTIGLIVFINRLWPIVVGAGLEIVSEKV